MPLIEALHKGVREQERRQDQKGFPSPELVVRFLLFPPVSVAVSMLDVPFTTVFKPLKPIDLKPMTLFLLPPSLSLILNPIPAPPSLLGVTGACPSTAMPLSTTPTLSPRVVPCKFPVEVVLTDANELLDPLSILVRGRRLLFRPDPGVAAVVPESSALVRRVMLRLLIGRMVEEGPSRLLGR